MVRYQKIKKIFALAGLATLLSLAGGCGTARQSGVALYLPEYDYRYFPADTLIVAKNNSFIPFRENENTSRIAVDTLFFEKTEENTDSVTFGTTVQSLHTGKILISDSATTLVAGNNQSIAPDKNSKILLSHTPNDSVRAPISNSKTDIIRATAAVEEIVPDTFVVDVSDKATDKIGQIAREENASIHIVTQTTAMQQDTIFQKNETTPELKMSVVPDTVHAEVALADIVKTSEYRSENRTPNTYSPNQTSEQKDVAVHTGKQYVAATTEKPKNYLTATPTEKTYPPVVASKNENTALQAKVDELMRQNQQLQNTIYSIKSSVEANRSQQGDTRANNDRLISDLSNSLGVITNLMTMNAIAGSKATDTIIRKVVVRDTTLKLDTVFADRMKENPQLTAENELLKDSLYKMQRYISLKNQALSSMENRMTTQRNTDSIQLTAYYAAGKLISKNEKQLLDHLKRKTEGKTVQKISLIGYTDRSGSPQVNLRLSNQRAVRLVDELIKAGIKREQIFLQYFGSQYASGKVVHEERRVEVIVETEK